MKKSFEDLKECAKRTLNLSFSISFNMIPIPIRRRNKKDIIDTYNLVEALLEND